MLSKRIAQIGLIYSAISKKLSRVEIIRGLLSFITFFSGRPRPIEQCGALKKLHNQCRQDYAIFYNT